MISWPTLIEYSLNIVYMSAQNITQHGNWVSIEFGAHYFSGHL